MKKWLPYMIVIAVLLAASFVVPHRTVDPWGLFNPYSLIRILLALTALQVFSSLLMSFLRGHHAGLLLGFLGGLISSTALAVSLSNQSQDCSEDEARLLSLTYLSALLGTVVLAAVLSMIGSDQLNWRLQGVFLGPIVVSLWLVVWRARSIQKIQFKPDSIPTLSVKSVLSLGLIIMLFLVFSKVLQTYLGEVGQYYLTFLTCLFELHGSIIGNTQLLQNGTVNAATAGNLFALGILASYIAKMAIVIVMGSRSFKKRIIKYTGWLSLSLIVAWVFASAALAF
ncbi:DUF4010 domain-containing protein [Bdellovibrio sp. KM01]|uniref:DUF4010 domain-containing protein n=1 Tax=Bdellovibrio sp. KM01 TaxID=2748865 RepID=UPI0015EABCE3|nr:DUF4010 domain-containing protein [Bdellovibrio sp. KM01]QLY26441.1 DUF4010 domain-containing protein [Bdellovibrio sp. KM01]